jgi:uncharacterized protein DUF4160
MPRVFDWNGYRFHFFSNEGDPREPVHVHVTRAPATAKFWIRPQPAVAYNKGFPAKVLSQLISVIESRADEIENAWHDHFA